MKKKVFSLMMTLLLAFMGVAKADVVTIGDGTGTTYYGPFNSLWYYSFVEQVYTADEIGTAGTINAISFNLSSGSQTNAIDVYMKNVSRTNFSDNTDWEPVTASDIVFSGTVTFNAGWTTITLDTPFQYDGTSNLMIGMHEYTSGYSTLYFTYTAVTGGLISGHSDSYDPNPTNMGSYSGTMYVQNYRNNIQIDITPGAAGDEDIVEVGTGTEIAYIFPFNTIWGYSYEEALYLGGEINHAAGNITTIAYNLAQTYTAAQTDHIEVYMKNVSRTSFASDTDFETLTTADKVYDGNWTIPANTTGWITINLDTPFAYDGTSNLIVAIHENTPGYDTRNFYKTTTSGYTTIQCYSDNGDVDPFTGNYYGSSTRNERANIQLTFAASEEPEYEAGLHTLATYGVGDAAEELIDLLHIQRPNGAWMEPYHFQLYNDGDHSVDVLYIDFLHNNGYFSMDEETTEYPFTVPNTGLAGAVDLYINTNTEWEDTEVINSLLAVNTDERSTHLFEILAEPYMPYCPDVFEKAYPLGLLATGQTWRMYASEMWSERNPNVPYDLHANYDMPDFEENIPDGYDAVIKFTANHDIMLNAYVNDGENGKVALYRVDFAGEDGPMADNYYDGRPFINIPAGAQPPYEAQLGHGTTTTGYMPFYCFYNYSISAQLYRADELAAAGVNTAPMTSVSYECSATNGNTQNGITIWMANVNDNVVPSSSPLASGMTKVYEGSCTPAVGWNEFVFNQNEFAWDGSSNIMVLFQRNNGAWASGISWKAEAQSYTATGYSYNDSEGAYNVMTNSYVFGSTGYYYGGTVSSRANTIFKSNGGRYVANNRETLTYNFEDGTMQGWTLLQGPNATSWNNWFHCYDYDFYDYSTGYGHNGSNGFMISESYISPDDPVYPDNYLVSPQIALGGSITFWATDSNDDYGAEHFGVAVSTTNNTNVNAFTMINEWTLLAKASKTGATRTIHDNVWYQYTANLSNFAGQTGYVAIRHFNCYDQWILCVDDITITTPGSTPVDPDQPVVPTPTSFSAGPVIENLNVLAGTYYLVASSTDPDFEVVINAEELPCPIEAVTNIYPEDNAWGIPSSNLTLLWTLNDYCNEWRIVFGSTYYPEDEPEHPATYISEWTSNLAQSLRITDYVELWDNTNYFWRIEQRSNPGTEYECVTSGPVFGFTTAFDIPQNLQVNGAGETNIFETEEDVTLTWNRIYDRNRNNDRTFRRYRIYWNGELYDETTDNDVTEVSYTIPNAEFHYNMVPHVPELFNVTAVYDEGESPMSNTVAVHVSGYGTISGTAYEQDGVTPIGGVTVIVTGTNEFGDAEEYPFITNEQGYYEGEIHVGTYTAMAYMDGYQPTVTTHQVPFGIVYQQLTDHVDFIMDETFYYPATVCARTVYVPGVEGDTLVQVWWDGWAFDGSSVVPGGAFEAQIGEGTGTSTYAPFHTLWNYSLSETLYRADELAEAGVTGAAMTSLSYYVASTTCTTPQNNISIWMANVSDDALTSTSHTTANMTLVYTGNNVLPVAGQWNEFVLNEGNFSWDGQSNILIVCQRQNGSWQGSISWQTHTAGFTGMTYAYTDNAPGYNAASQTYSMSTSTSRPNIIMKAGGREAAIGDVNRALHHFNIYRTDCYNDGPYNSDNTVFLASVWRPDTSYFDVQWPEVPVGVYKWGVSAVYQGNQADNPNNPRVDYPFEERESEIMWSDQCGPCIDKDMQTDITVNVVCNSADSPEGCVVSFTNLNEGEQFNHPQPSITLDASGFQAVTPFRKGDYLVTVYLPGYELIQVEESIWGHRDLRYVLTEIIYGAKNLYVSRTGWAMWEPETWEDYPIPEGAITGPSIIDFETGDFSQFAFNNASGYPWTVAHEGQDGGYCMKSGNGGVASSTSTISATVNYTSAGLISFDYKSQGEGTTYDVSKFMIDGVQQFSYGAVGSWNSFTANVAAGEHTFTWSYTKDSSVNPTGDCFLVDNINFNIGGSRAVAEERHLEGFKIMCTSLDDEPIFNHNTPVDQPFCQLTTVDPWSGQPMLIEGEFYKVKVATIYSTGQSPWCEPVIWQYEPCDHWGPVDEVTAGTNTQGNHIEWVFEHGHNQWIDPNDPGQGGEASTFSVNFDEGMPEGWTTIDANNDNYNWVLGSQIGGIYLVAGASLAGTGHNSSEDMICSGSYSNVTNQAITPDNYLVSPQVNLVAGSTFSFWACGQDASYVAEHFGVFVSDNGTSDWTMVNEWTMTAKSGGNGAMGIGRNGETRAQGTWHNYTVDLSAFAGQKYVAIRHFNCNDMFILNVDDIELTAGAKGGNDGISLYHDQEIYRQYAEDGVLLNFLGIDNIGFRAYLLYKITNDNRFTMTAENAYGQFILNAAYEMDDFMGEFESFFEESSYEFSLFTKMDIYNKLTEWKNGVSPDYYNSIIMDVALSNARVENDQCINSLPFCTTDVIEFEAASTSSTAQEEGMDDGCIGSSYNPSFYHMRIHDAGPFVIHMEGHDPNNGTTRDIDFCMWGPYTEQEVMSGYACTHLTGDKIMDCCYSASYTEDCYLGYPDGQHQHNTGHGSINYHVPAVGEYYILMITNFSQQPCVINFTKTEGEGETDCDIVTPTDILGFLITLDGEYLTIVGPDEREYTHEGEFGEHEYCVRPIYPGPAILPDTNYYFSMGCPVCSSTSGDIVEVCDPGNPIYAEVNGTDDQVHLWWSEQPEPPTPAEGTTFVYDFENSSLEGLTTIDADGDGYTWVLGSAVGGVYLAAGASLAGSGHNASADLVCSGSFSNATGSALNPNNFLVFPQSTIVDGSTFSFWACGQDASWVAEHFGVAVSTTGNTSATDFTTVQEWTMTAKTAKAANAVRDGRAQGNWYQYTVDLSDYAGMDVYIAIRHFNCTDMFILDVDDVELSIPAKGNRDGIIGYNIYRSTDNVDYTLIATVDGDVTEYFDAPGAGTYYYKVTALYADGCESEPAVSGENPEVNYVMVGVTGIGENSAEVNLFPNPTKGNVTIQAMNMHRVTVVSVLGQVVFDTELDQDEYILNMAKFNTGVYMVRVYTDEGVTVKRVTVLH